MTIEFNVKQIKELMESFHIMSGIRFVLFDRDFKEIISFPEENCNFCKIMKSCPKTRRRCAYADRRSFEKCEKANSLVIYKCHAGLVEAVIPLHENEKIVGYLMFGQISDNPKKDRLYDNIEDWHNKYGLCKEALISAIGDITYKTNDEIQAAAKIMEACTSYIIYKELITPQDSRIVEAAKKHIENHLECELNIIALCKELNIGRTRLYELFKAEAGMGIAEYLKKRRLHRAKKLLKTTDLTIAEISAQVGFADYNYFSRVYKKAYGKSPKHYR